MYYIFLEINTIVRNFLSSQPSKKTKKIILDVEERSIVSLLDKLVAVCPDVKFGSYPYVIRISSFSV